MIYFKDFAPKIKKQGIFKTYFEALEEALAAANEWIAAGRIDVVNIETVVLPEI